MYLHHYGGIYADLDYAAIRPADDLLALMQNATVLLGKDCGMANSGECDRHDQRLPNAFMASVPGHPFWMFVVYQMLRGIWRDGIDASMPAPNVATGPAPLSWAYAHYGRHQEQTSEQSDVSDILILEKEVIPFRWTDHHGSYSLGCCFDNDNILYNVSCCQSMFPDSYLITFWSATWWG